MLAPSLFFFLCAIITITRSETAIQAEQKQIFPNLQLEQNKYTLYNTKQFDSSLKHVSCDSSSSLIHLHFKTIHAARKFEKKLTNANNQQVVLMMDKTTNQCEKNKFSLVKQHEIINNAVVRLVTDKQISQDEWIKDFGFDYTPPNDDDKEIIIIQNDETMGKDIQQMSKDIKPPQKKVVFVAARDEEQEEEENTNKNYFVFSSSSSADDGLYWKRNVAVAAVFMTVTIGVVIWLIANKTCGKKNEEFKNDNDVDADIENILRSEVGYGAVDVM